MTFRLEIIMDAESKDDFINTVMALSPKELKEHIDHYFYPFSEEYTDLVNQIEGLKQSMKHAGYGMKDLHRLRMLEADLEELKEREAMLEELE